MCGSTNMALVILLLLGMLFLQCVMGVSWMPKAVRDVLDEADNNHMRFFPDFRLERDATGSVDVKKMSQGLLMRFGRNRSHAVERGNRNASSRTGGGVGAAAAAAAFPSNVHFLLNMFESGFGFPRSSNDVLPDGSSYWSSPTYLSVGGLNMAGEAVPLDSMAPMSERITARYSLSLSDGALWEIALSLAGLRSVAFVYENEVLYASSTGAAGSANGAPGGIIDLRGDTDSLLYGLSKIPGSSLSEVVYPENVTHFSDLNGTAAGAATKTGPGAYFYRFIVPHYRLTDPMVGNYGAAWKYPWPDGESANAWNTFGEVHFGEWQANTGENIWGAILGPLQALSLATQNNLTNSTCGSYFHMPSPVPCTWESFDLVPPPVQLGISILPALLAMQTEVGALTHFPWGTMFFPPDADEGAYVSIADNLVALAGVRMMTEVLDNYTSSTSDPTLLFAKNAFQQLRQGLEKFFSSPSNELFVDVNTIRRGGRGGGSLIVSGGHVNATTGIFVPEPLLSSFGGLDTEAQLLAMTMLDLDGLFGEGFTMGMWTQVKEYTGVWNPDNALVGFGVNLHPSESSLNSTTTHALWCSSLTFAGINAAQVLASNFPENATYFLGEATSMLNGVSQLWPAGLRFPDGSYVMSNQRFVVPRRWFSNPISSLGATAWSVLQDANCNPFAWMCGGKPALRSNNNHPPPSSSSWPSWLFGR